MHLYRTAAAALLLWSHNAAVVAQQVSLTETSEITFVEGTRTDIIRVQTGAPTGPYRTYATKITLTISGSGSESETGSLTSTLTGEFTGTETTSVNETETGTGTRTGTETGPAQPTNTQPCNNYVEFCTRKYSNITVVGAHNSPFVRPGNAGSNQALPVKTQLNDGIRFLQAQIQWPSNSSAPHFCHTTCDLLDAGPITDWLTEVRQWVDDHPYDVVTILLGNGNYSDPSLYVPYIQQTGILKYAYEAPYLPMSLDDWPTLEELIVRGKRVIIFMDYMADQKKYPWMLDEFPQMWETPFNPTDRSFPCTVQRPPGLDEQATKDRLYLLNNNLAAEFNVFGAQLLVPAVSLLNETNNYTGYGSLGESAAGCRADWGRAPNVLNVDYYNYGGYPGSVFQVAADMNNVTYKRGSCCGTVSGASRLLGGGRGSWGVLAAAMLAALLAS